MNRVLRIVLLALCTTILCTGVLVRPSYGQVTVTVSFAPPALPVYELPPCPEDGYLWTPGYWAWDPDDGYYWVPGTWEMAPEPGLLWTPAWWGWDNGGYIFHDGFWATDVGFYGGIDYGFGYFGVGFVGGGWQGGHFRYNTAVLNVDTTIIHNTYVDRTVIVDHHDGNHASYNGGEGGISSRPTPQEERVQQERHVAPPAAQQQHVESARGNPAQRASQNQGKPPIAATPQPGNFNGRGVEQSKEAGAPYHPPANAPGGNGHEPAAGGAHPGEGPTGQSGQPGQPGQAGQAGQPDQSHGGQPSPGQSPAGQAPAAPGKNPGHASDLQPHQGTPPNTGNPKLDQKYQQQQQKLMDQQNKEHQQLQQKQEQDHQKAQQQNQNQQQQSQMEQKHQQQTQQMEQRHTQQTEHLQTKQAPQAKPK
jgi:hypothetical protein